MKCTKFTNVSSALSEIELELQNINSNEEWIKFLTFCSKFHRYSFQNTMLIFLQFPSASHVAGYTKWKSIGRHIKRGETGIRIFAPCVYKRDVAAPLTDDNSVIKAFKLVSVFDLSQTDGNDEDLPVLICGLIDHNCNATSIYTHLLNIIDIPVSESSSLAAKGCYYINEYRIEINARLTVSHKIKTLCHEYSHHLHHIKYFDNEDKDVCEMIAESSAFVICNYLGIDTSNYSFPYIHSWCDDIVKFKNSSIKIKQISSDIISMLEDTSTSTVTSAV